MLRPSSNIRPAMSPLMVFDWMHLATPRALDVIAALSTFFIELGIPAAVAICRQRRRKL